MAYRLKSVRYQALDRNILLQNENGPCPLLAAANALLLRGVVSLPAECVRARVASIDDVVNVLAERALSVEGSEHHLNELMSIFPKLQYGMDVNPKFTAGPTGVEYTSNLTAFDLLNVDLVHGWLLDPQDSETHQLIGAKTYNQLVEHVIRGQEASSALESLGEELKQKELQLQKKSEKKEQAAESEKESSANEENCPDASWVEVSPSENGKEPESAVPPLETAPDETELTKAATVVETSTAVAETIEEEITVEVTEGDKDIEGAAADASEADPSEESQKVTQPSAQGELGSSLENSSADAKELEAAIPEIRKKINELSVIATEGGIINSFLSSSSHQLTHYGLHELYDYVAEESLSVFFRNNHFATLTKHDGVLYLLVTDLGYANVPEVMWEKLDGIDGNTEYVNSNFVKPAALSESASAGPIINPEHMLAQRGQSEADYQLALELSKHHGEGLPQQQLDDQEGKLVAAATEASLRTYNGMSSDYGMSSEIAEANDGVQAASSPTIAEIPHVGVPLIQNANSAMEDQDHVIAMQLQAQMERDEDPSERLARQLQAQENRRAVSNNSSQRRPNSGTAASRANDSKSSCVIS